MSRLCDVRRPPARGPHPAARTNAGSAPHVAILATGAWTVALIAVLSSFDTLVNYLSAAMWIFYGAVGVAVVVSRRRAGPCHPLRPSSHLSSHSTPKGNQGLTGSVFSLWHCKLCAPGSHLSYPTYCRLTSRARVS